MLNGYFKKKSQELLSLADVKINGTRPWDIQVYNENVYRRVFAQGSLGLGESYMDGWWDCKSLDQFFYKTFSANLDKNIKFNPSVWFTVLLYRFFNLHIKSRAFQIGEQFYDLGNELFMKTFDKLLMCSSGHWDNAKNLDEAQEAKLDIVCKKLGLKPGMRVLDIGSGWGGFAKYASENYKTRVVGITVSKQQVAHTKRMCSGLPVDVRLQDYRRVHENFDRVISMGMFEHVGYKNYRIFMEVVHRCLNEDGLFLLETMGLNRSDYHPGPWLDKYVMPNTMFPSIALIGKATEKLLVMKEWENFPADYDKTYMAWFSNFDNNWDRLKSGYNERFYRMWKYYHTSVAASFRAGYTQSWRILFSKHK